MMVPSRHLGAGGCSGGPRVSRLLEVFLYATFSRLLKGNRLPTVVNPLEQSHAYGVKANSNA